MEGLLILHSMIFGACGCVWLANRKGYGSGAAFLVGLFGGPWGLLIYAGAPDMVARRIASYGEASPSARPIDSRPATAPTSGESTSQTSGEGESKPNSKPAKFEFPDGDWDAPKHRGPPGG